MVVRIVPVLLVFQIQGAINSLPYDFWLSYSLIFFVSLQVSDRGYIWRCVCVSLMCVWMCVCLCVGFLWFSFFLFFFAHLNYVCLSKDWLGVALPPFSLALALFFLIFRVWTHPWAQNTRGSIVTVTIVNFWKYRLTPLSLTRCSIDLWWHQRVENGG